DRRAAQDTADAGKQLAADRERQGIRVRANRRVADLALVQGERAGRDQRTERVQRHRTGDVHVERIGNVEREERQTARRIATPIELRRARCLVQLHVTA